MYDLKYMYECSVHVVYAYLSVQVCMFVHMEARGRGLP